MRAQKQIVVASYKEAKDQLDALFASGRERRRGSLRVKPLFNPG